MSFTGKFEALSETTMTRYQQGGIMIGDIVKIKKNALKHPKVKEMQDNMKANIEMFMDTDLNISVTAINSTRPSQGDMGDGLGLGTTSAPTDFWISVAVLHSPGFKGNPVVIPAEIVEVQDFGANLPPIPDSLKRKNVIDIKPVEVGSYNGKDQLPTKNTVLSKESIEDIYQNMGVGSTPTNVTVRIPMEDTDEFKTSLDDLGITYSVVGTNRFELHGKLEDIQSVIQGPDDAQTGIVDVEVIQGPPNPAMAPHALPMDSVPTDTPTDGNEETKDDDDEDKKKFPNNLEEAYQRIGSSVKSYTIAIPNAFADNVSTYLASEDINHNAVVDGGKTLIEIYSECTADDILSDLKTNVMGDLTYLKVWVN